MNVENRYRGRCDVPLDAQGYQDAVDAARQLSHLGLAAVYTGGLRRTIATAQIIADEARIPDIRIMHGLINVDYGAWEGLTAQEAEIYDPIAFKLYKTSPSRAVCPNGERLRDAQKRMLEALSIIAARHEGERVAVISHAVMIRLAVAALEHTEGEQCASPSDVGPTRPWVPWTADCGCSSCPPAPTWTDDPGTPTRLPHDTAPSSRQRPATVMGTQVSPRLVLFQ